MFKSRADLKLKIMEKEFQSSKDNKTKKLTTDITIMTFKAISIYYVRRELKKLLYIDDYDYILEHS